MILYEAGRHDAIQVSTLCCYKARILLSSHFIQVLSILYPLHPFSLSLSLSISLSSFSSSSSLPPIHDRPTFQGLCPYTSGILITRPFNITKYEIYCLYLSILPYSHIPYATSTPEYSTWLLPTRHDYTLKPGNSLRIPDRLTHTDGVRILSPDRRCFSPSVLASPYLTGEKRSLRWWSLQLLRTTREQIDNAQPEDRG